MWAAEKKIKSLALIPYWVLESYVLLIEESSDIYRVYHVQERKFRIYDIMDKNMNVSD